MVFSADFSLFFFVHNKSGEKEMMTFSSFSPFLPVHISTESRGTTLASDSFTDLMAPDEQ